MVNYKNIKYFEHAAFWLFIYLFIFDYYWDGENGAEALGKTLLEIATYAIIVYLNLLIFIPVFLKKNRLLAFLSACVCLVIGYVALIRNSGLESFFYELGGWRNVFSMILNTSLFLLISTLFWYFKQWQIEREQQLRLKAEKLESELRFLRSQISPHFIFNTLNNIYVLAVQKHDNTAPMVARLSTLLRYVLYDIERGRVALKKELETIREYLDLHLLRKPRSTNVDLYIEGTPTGWQITPMLLLNFVENCFKHGNIENDPTAFIKIYCEIGSDGLLLFSTENSHRLGDSTNKKGGIGLENARRQLEIDFPNAHKLEIMEDTFVFRIQLSLQLKKV